MCYYCNCWHLRKGWFWPKDIFFWNVDISILLEINCFSEKWHKFIKQGIPTGGSSQDFPFSVPFVCGPVQGFHHHRKRRPLVLAWPPCPLLHSPATKPACPAAQWCSSSAGGKDSCAFLSVSPLWLKQGWDKQKQQTLFYMVLLTDAHLSWFLVFGPHKISSPLCTDTQIT